MGPMIRGARAVVMGLLWPALVRAQPAEPERDAKAFQITPYVWATGVGGRIQPTAGGPVFRAGRSFGDLLEDLDAAFFVNGYARTGRWVFAADLSRSVSSREGLAPTGNPAIPVVPAEGRLAQTSLTALTGVRALQDRKITIDALIGLRAWWIGARVAAPALGSARAPGQSFADPVGAVRVNAALGRGWSVLLYGDAGGLGAGSEFTAQAAATLNARVARRVWLSAGYRHLTVDYRDRGAGIDVDLSGPLFGATYSF